MHAVYLQKFQADIEKFYCDSIPPRPISDFSVEAGIIEAVTSTEETIAPQRSLSSDTLETELERHTPWDKNGKAVPVMSKVAVVSYTNYH